MAALRRDESFEIRPKLRQPAPELGTRARRTIGLILQATGDLIMARGYGGARIDDIAQAAGISRASFYTYFPSKRDALLALGTDSLSRAMELVQAVLELSSEHGRPDLEGWVSMYMDYLEEDGSLAFAWTQAAHEDDEIRRAGQRGHLEMCRRLGLALGSFADADPRDAVEQGLIVVAMLERAWAYSRLYGSAIDHAALTRQIVRMLEALTGAGPGSHRET
jgi:AcrR family transcriptional regulator